MKENFLKRIAIVPILLVYFLVMYLALFSDHSPYPGGLSLFGAEENVVEVESNKYIDTFISVQKRESRTLELHSFWVLQPLLLKWNPKKFLNL